MVLSARCPWREVRNGVGSQYCCVSILNSASPIRADLSNRLIHPFVLPPSNGAAGSAVVEARTPFASPGPPSALLDTTLCLPRQPIKPRLPPRAARRQTPANPMVLPRCAASRVVSAVSPACGHQYSVDGKPPASARHAIPRPAPLAPWRGPRGWGVRGCSRRASGARKNNRPPRPRRHATKPSAPQGRRPGLLVPTLAASQKAFFFVSPAMGSA